MIRILAILALLIVPAGAYCSDDSMLFAMGMGQMAGMAEWEAKHVIERYEAGEINQSQCETYLSLWQGSANIYNAFLSANFNNTIYEKLKLEFKL